MHPLLSVGTSNRATRKLLPLVPMSSSFNSPIAKTEETLIRKNKKIHQERSLFPGSVCRRKVAVETGLRFSTVVSFCSPAPSALVAMVAHSHKRNTHSIHWLLAQNVLSSSLHGCQDLGFSVLFLLGGSIGQMSCSLVSHAYQVTEPVTLHCES